MIAQSTVLREVYDLLWDPFLATVLLGTVLAFLGVHVILRRIVFVGVALAEMSSLGIATAFLFEGFAWTAQGGPLSLLSDHALMGGVFNLLGLLFFLPPETRRLSRETRIGIGFAAAGALAVLLVSQSSKGMDEIRVLMVGDPLFVTHRDVFVVLAVLVPSAFAVALFFRRFLLVAFDREMAVSLGIRARRWDVLFFLVLGLSVAIAIHDAGVLFTIGYLVLPGATALAFARRPWAVFGGAAATGLACSASGFVLGHALDLPLGPTTVALAFAVFLAARVSVRLRARFSPA